MHLYLHIGAEKTGTSAIQRFLQINRQRLAGDGVLFPRVPGEENHMALAAAAQDEAKRDDLRLLYRLDSAAAIATFRERLAAALRGELMAARAGKVVLSGEHCSSRLVTEPEIARLHGMLAPLFDAITVVLYVRRQDEVLSSHYSTLMKTGYTHEIRMPPEEEIVSHYDYFSMAERWAAIFGRESMVVRRYDRRWLRNGDAVDDFCAVVGIDAPSEASGYERPPRLNQSLDATACEFLRMFNAHLPRFLEKGINPARGDIENMLLHVSRGQVPCLPPAELESFTASCRASNARLADAYFGGAAEGEGDPLFGAAEAVRPRASQTDLTLDAAMRIFARLWEQKQTEVSRLRRELMALRRIRREGAPR